MWYVVGLVFYPENPTNIIFSDRENQTKIIVVFIDCFALVLRFIILVVFTFVYFSSYLIDYLTF